MAAWCDYRVPAGGKLWLAVFAACIIFFGGGAGSILWVTLLQKKGSLLPPHASSWRRHSCTENTPEGSRHYSTATHLIFLGFVFLGGTEWGGLTSESRVNRKSRHYPHVRTHLKSLELHCPNLSPFVIFWTLSLTKQKCQWVGVCVCLFFFCWTSLTASFSLNKGPQWRISSCHGPPPSSCCNPTCAAAPWKGFSLPRCLSPWALIEFFGT